MPDEPRLPIGLEILAMRKSAEEMAARPYQRQDCPVCGWALETAADGVIHCRLCGWVDQRAIKRDVPR